jgi:AAA domain/Relaxase/Mobilisation nuclease domain
MIPKIVTGTGISGALAYVMGQGNDAQTGKRLELVPGETSRATIIGGQNFGFEIEDAADLELARRIMEYQGLPQNQAGKTRKLDNDCYHASLSWGIGQEPSREEMLQAGQEFLKAVGLEKARAVFVAHDDTDHRHIHVVASRIDPETGRSLRMDYDKKAAQKWALEWEREHGQQRTPEQGKNFHALIDGIEKRDAQAVLSHVTRDKPTFQTWELNRALGYGDLTDADKATFRAQILGEKNVIGLSDTRDAAVSRYTTVEALAPEMALMSDAGKLKDQHHHAARASHVEKAIKEFTLKPEQAEALRHLTEANGLGILWGEAGTGKSHTLKATRAVYEAAGKDVRGLSWTNDVAEQMRGDGFKNASTIARELDDLAKGRTSWTRNTVLVVDEAAMISTEALGRLASAARHAGAKLILAGDDAQLASIERGGTFETLRQKHGAAILSDVQRVKNVAEQAAWGEMHKGDFRPALEIADKAGNIHWSTRQSDTLKQMAARYTDDLQATPDKKRFMFAQTNADVATLNAHARGLHKARGDLGEDHALKTATGEAQFAEGDRIQFTGNGRTKDERRAGLVNGRVGTIAALEVSEDGRAKVTVELDTRTGEKAQLVSFVVGDDARAGEFDKFKHGYAGTIYRLLRRAHAAPRSRAHLRRA